LPPGYAETEMGLSQVATDTREAHQDGTVSLTGAILRPMSVSLEDPKRFDSVLVDPFDLYCFTRGSFRIRKKSYAKPAQPLVLVRVVPQMEGGGISPSRSRP
jgi:hypothetical protein